MPASGLTTIADPFETCQLGHRTDAATNQGIEAAAGSLVLLEQHRIGIGRPRVEYIDGEPHLHPAVLDPQWKLSGEDATLQSVRGRSRRHERDERQDHPQTVRTELDPVDRLAQTASPGIGQQALPQALSFSQ
jgi:hypothetical protein